MTYFETMTEMQNNINADELLAREAYYETEQKLVTAIGEYILGAEVDCKALGSGKITSFFGIAVDNMFVEIAFEDGTTGKYSLNHIMNNKFIDITSISEINEVWNSTFEVHTTLTSVYNESMRVLQQMQIEADKKAKAEKKAEEKYQKQKEKAIQDFDTLVQQADKTLSTDEEFYYALGWLTKHIGSVSAALPDYLESAFTKHFGTETNARIVDSKKRTCNGNSMQWTFGFKATLRKPENIPSILTQYLSTTGKAIANTSFIWDLVDNYGFKFGKKQNIDEIKQTIPNRYMASFEAGLA